MYQNQTYPVPKPPFVCPQNFPLKSEPSLASSRRRVLSYFHYPRRSRLRASYLSPDRPDRAELLKLCIDSSWRSGAKAVSSKDFRFQSLPNFFL
jgi:hypothetical protein